MLEIYLNDHLAGSTAATELVKRAASSNRGNEYGAFLERLAGEIEEDRAALISIMERLDARVDRVKVWGAWSGEKLGRLKLNGRLFSYSPLSRVVEFEGLFLGVTGKLGLWRALDALRAREPRLEELDLASLITRAERQRDELEGFRTRAVVEALA